jgi:hypothetical protein
LRDDTVGSRKTGLEPGKMKPSRSSEDGPREQGITVGSNKGYDTGKLLARAAAGA